MPHDNAQTLAAVRSIIRRETDSARWYVSYYCVNERRWEGLDAEELLSLAENIDFSPETWRQFLDRLDRFDLVLALVAGYTDGETVSAAKALESALTELEAFRDTLMPVSHLWD